MSTVWHYQIGDPTATRLSEGTVEAVDWYGALNEVTKVIKASGREPIEVYVWSDDA